MPRSTISLLALLVSAACGPLGRSGGGAADGTLAVAWTGSTAGRFSAPAEARWCAADTLLEVIAARHDTAVGFTLLPRPAVDTGTYPVSPVEVASPARPQSGLALRWLAENDLMQFEGSAGRIRVTARDQNQLSGTVSGELRRQLARDSVRLTGRFTRIPVKPAADGCGRAVKP